MKKKIVSLAMAAAMTLSCAPAILAGCGSDDSTDYEHTIIFYSSQGQNLREVTKIAISKFKEKYPDWDVQHTAPGGYDELKTKIVNDLQGEYQPDLAYCYADHVAQYLSTETVLDMNQFINSKEKVSDITSVGDGVASDAILGFTQTELDDFVETYWREGKATNFTGYDEFGYNADSMLTLPFVKSTELLYYNKTVLDELKLKVPETWDELWAQGPVLKAKYPTATLLGYDSEANWLINMCQQNGWGYTSADKNQHYLFNSNNDGLKAWLTSLNGYYENELLTTQKDYNAYTSALFTKGPKDGGILYCIGSSGGASYQESSSFTAEVAAIPGTKKDDGTINKSVISQGPSLVMFKSGYGVSNADEKAKMTFLFMKELFDVEFQAAFSMEAGYNPCLKSVYENATYAEHMAGDSLVAKACGIAQTLQDYFFTSPAFVGSSRAREQMTTVVVDVMQGSKTADIALKTAYKNCGGK